MVKGTKETEKAVSVDLHAGTKSRIKARCTGELCFEDDFFTVKLGKDTDPECRKLLSDVALQNKKIRFEIDNE